MLTIAENEQDNDIAFDFSSDLHYQWPDPSVLRMAFDRDPGVTQDGLVPLLGMRGIFDSLGLRTLAVDDNLNAVGLALQHYSNVERFALTGPRFRYCLEALTQETFRDRVQMLGNIRSFSLNDVTLDRQWAFAVVDLFEGTQIVKVKIQNSRGVTEKALDALRQRFEVDWDGKGS